MHSTGTVSDRKAGMIPVSFSTMLHFETNLRLLFLLVKYTTTGAMRVFQRAGENTALVRCLYIGTGTVIADWLLCRRYFVLQLPL
jgi:hypothetical protein